jgi:pimeloyl-ACP methyl ester carboxylesterase
MEPWPGLAPFGRTLDLGHGQERIHVFDAGPGRADAPVLVFVHGLGDEADTWRHLFPLLSDRFRLIAVDLPGFGRSRAAGRVSVPSCAAAVLGVIDALAAGPAFLVGSSLGAAIAELVAFRAPDRVDGLVLVDGGLPMPAGLLRPLLPLLVPVMGERLYASSRGKPPEAVFASLAPYYADLAAMPEADRAFLRRRVVERVESVAQRTAYLSLFRDLALRVMFRAGTFRSGLARLGRPLLILWGSDDRVVPRAMADLLSLIAPQARIVDIPGAGHLPHQERPAEVAAALSGFVLSP